MALHALRKHRDTLKRVSNYESDLDDLGEIFDRGTSILNISVASEQDYGSWKTYWDQWRAEVETYLIDHFGQRERYLFRNSVLVERNLSGQGFNDAHDFQRDQLVCKLEILRGMIVRHCDQAAIWRSETK